MKNIDIKREYKEEYWCSQCINYVGQYENKELEAPCLIKTYCVCNYDKACEQFILSKNKC